MEFMNYTLAAFPLPVAVALALAAVLMLLAQREASGPQIVYYVSTQGSDEWSGTLAEPAEDGADGPFATLDHARRAIREARSTASDDTTFRVIIHGGTYHLDAPLRFDPDDCGSPDAPVIYEAFAGEEPVISGGRPITGWEPADEEGVWQARVPEAQSGKWAFRQLFVNGSRRCCARHPNEGYLRIAEPLPATLEGSDEPNPQAHLTFRYHDGDMPIGADEFADAAVIAYHAWATSIHTIAELDEAARTVTFTRPAPWAFGRWEKEQRYVIENARAAFDAPGEWYLDRRAGMLYYRPLPGEIMTEAEVIAPVTDRLLTLAGDPENLRFVVNIHFRGLRFVHTDWTLEDSGCTDSQAAAGLDGAITASGTHECSWEQCEIAHVGRYALWLGRGCRDNRVIQCHIHDLGAGGVKIGEKTSPENVHTATAHNVVENCFIHDGGHVFPAAVGVWIGRSSSNTVRSNEICDFFYTGVSVGWSWGYDPGTAMQNLVEYNHIHHLGKGVLSDMGGIYTLGISPGTHLYYNHIHDVHSYSYGGWGIYPDEGSTHIIIERNLVHDTRTGGFHQHYGRENVVQSNIFAFSEQMQISRTREERHSSFDFQLNIVICDNPQVLGGRWSNNNYNIEKNIYWHADGGELEFDGMTFQEWQAEGRDIQSKIFDPLFVDAKKRDFRLQLASPALRMGFTPIDTSRIGLYGDPDWVDLPRRRGERS